MLKQHIKNLFHQSMYYGAGQAVRRFFSIFTAPIMTRIFSPADYGVIALISTTIAFGSLVVGLGISAGIFRHYYEVNDEKRKILLFSGISSQMVIIIAGVLVGVIFAEPISNVIFKTDKYANIIRLAFLQIPITELFEHLCTLLRYQNKAKRFMMISVLQLTLNLLFLLFYVVYLRLGIPGVYLNTITANAIPMIVLMFLLRRHYSLKINWTYVKDCLAFSLPLMPGWFVNMYLMQSNRFFLQAYHSPEEVGLFSIAARIAGIAGMFMSIFFLAWDPLSYKLIKEKAQHFMYDFVARLFIFICSVVIIGITFFSKEVLIILTTEKFYPAYVVVGLIGLGQLTFYLNYFLGMGIIISKKTIFQSVARFGGAITASMIFIFFIPKYGIYGASIGLVAGYMTSSVGLYLFSNRLYKLPYDVKRIVASYLVTLMVIVLYAVYSSDQYSLSISAISLKMCLLFAASLCLIATSFNRGEIIKAVSAIRVRAFFGAMKLYSVK